MAPSIASQFLYANLGQVITGIKKLGFAQVLEVALGADMVATKEAQELVEKGFLTSSCCPAFVKYIETKYPGLKEKISHNFSPMVELAKFIKEGHPEATIVFIGPCIAKKAEVRKPEVRKYIDYAITFEELQALLDSREIPVEELPEDTLDLRVRRDHVMYDVWKKQGFIQTTEGNVVHYGFIEQFICQLGERYNIREIAYDRWNATMMVQALEDDGFTMIPFGQGFKDMSPPTKELMRLVLERHINHGGHPVLRWNMDNAFVRTDPAGNLKIDKEKSTEKVDGAVALVMALDRAMKNQGGGSVYDERGLLFI